MKITVFAGTDSSTSINKELIRHVLKNFEGHEIQFLDLNDFEMPIFGLDRLKKGHPEAAQKFLDVIEGSDALICSLAEHHRSYTVAFKNVFDWAATLEKNVFRNIPMFLMSASAEETGCKSVLDHAITYFPTYGGNIQAVYSLPNYYVNYDPEKGVINSELATQLKQEIEAFKQAFMPVV